MEEDGKKVKKVSLLITQLVPCKLSIQHANFIATLNQKTYVTGILGEEWLVCRQLHWINEVNYQKLWVAMYGL